LWLPPRLATYQARQATYHLSDFGEKKLTNEKIKYANSAPLPIASENTAAWEQNMVSMIVMIVPFCAFARLFV